jgi:hypothetical protein
MSFAGPRQRAVALLAAALLALLPVGEPRSEGLFEDSTELAVVIEFPVRRLIREKQAREEFPATLHYQGADGRKLSLPLKVRARGHTRLALCDFPPLRLEFDPAHTDGTPFAGERRLKLVTSCKADRRYRDYVRLEKRIYDAYALLTPASFRTRALAATYVDPTERMTPVAGPAFLLEDVDDVAKRVGMREARTTAVRPSEVDPAATNLLELFQFMIGNTDWSVHLPTDGEQECCHNGRVIGPRDGTGKLAIIPFDFDNAGIIDAEYAAVNPVVGVRRVRQRIYRGLCSRNAEVPGSIERFQQLRPQFEALFQGGGLGEWASRRALSYIEGFYEIVGDPAAVKEKIYGDCRPDPEPVSPAAAAAPAAKAGTGATGAAVAPAAAAGSGAAADVTDSAPSSDSFLGRLP